MNILNNTRTQRYFAKHPIVEIYKGYEIRTNGIDKFGFSSYLCDAAIAIYGITSTTIEGCREFIDTLVEQGIKQYDDEAVSKYIFANHSDNYTLALIITITIFYKHFYFNEKNLHFR